MSSDGDGGSSHAVPVAQHQRAFRALELTAPPPRCSDCALARETVQGGTTLSPLITACDIRDRLQEIHVYPDDWQPDQFEQLSRIIRPCQLEEHANTLIARGDDSLLLNLAQLQLMVGCRHETDLLTALALLERRCTSGGGTAAWLLDFLPDNDDRPMLSNHLDRMLVLLCSDKVSWAEGRCELGKLVA